MPITPKNQKRHPGAAYPFTKFTTTIVGPNDEVTDPALTAKVDFEAELMVVR
ncbi:MAG: fumarylacetoacetate hydrolase family protein [Anaerolineae bacterium]